MEVERSLAVLDGAVTILDGVAGVEAQTETVWRQANRYHVPRIAFINKMDRVGSRTVASLEAMQRLQGWGTPVLVQWPLMADEDGRGYTGTGNGGAGLHGIVDLVSLRLVLYQDASAAAAADAGEGGVGAGAALRALPFAEWSADPAYARVLAAMSPHRVHLVDTLAEADGAFFEQLMEAPAEHLDPALTPAIQAALRPLVHAGTLVPVFLGSAFRNIGISLLLDGVRDYLPSPTEAARLPTSPMQAAIMPSPGGTSTSAAPSPLLLYAFKVIHDAMRGEVVFARIYAGTLSAKTTLLNLSQGKRERAAKLLTVYADEYEEVQEMGPGNIVALLGLKHTATGDTLTTPEAAAASGKPNHPTLTCMHALSIPKPVIIRALVTPSLSVEKRLALALPSLLREDPSLTVSTDPETEVTMLSGMGALHLEIALHRLQGHYKLPELTMGTIQIHLREVLEGFGEGLGAGEVAWETPAFALSLRLSPKPTSPMPPAGSDAHLHDHPGLMDLALENELDLSHLDRAWRHPGDQLPIASKFPTLDALRAAMLAGLEAALSRGTTRTGGYPIVRCRVQLTSFRLRTAAPGQGELTLAAVQHSITKHLGHHLTARGCVSARWEPVMLVQYSLAPEYVGVVTNDIVGQR